MEKTSPESLSSSSPLTDCALVLFLASTVVHCIIGRKHLCRKFLSFFQSQVCSFVSKVSSYRKKSNWDFKTNETIKNPSISSPQFSFNERGDVKMRRDEVEMVMGNLGIFCDPRGEKLEPCLDSGDFSVLFEEEEPSFGELKEAFSVFAGNGDGFIGPIDLQRVLQNLGFKEGSNMDACKQMITAFDKNGDGQIDFNEFVQFMEKSFC